MKLLAAISPRIRRLVPSAERGYSVALLAFLVAIEFAGLQATSEFHDALAGVALVAVGLFTLAWHRSHPLAWLGHIQDAVTHRVARLEQLKYDIGIDFRGTPPYPRHLPRIVPQILVTLAVVIALGFTAWHYFPNGWRELGVRFSYVVYVLMLMTLWLMLFVCLLAGVFLPVAILDHRFRTVALDTPSGPPDAVIVAGYALIMLLVACVAPPIFAAALCGVIVLAGCIEALPHHREEVDVLWRNTDYRRSVRAVPLRRLVGLAVAAFGLGLFALIVWACGGRLTTAPTLDSNMPLTAFLGAITAWLLPGFVIVLGVQWWDFRRGDPARREPVTVHLADRTANAVAAIRRWGFAVTSPGVPRTKLHVGLKLVPEHESQATDFDPDWPLKVSAADLEGDIVRDRVARRDELQVRRRFFKGLAALVKETKSLAPSRGGGFLLAPHYWFIGSLLWTDPDRSPTEDGDALRPLGPPLRTVWDARVRQYLHQVLRAIQIDAIYLEDGVGHRKLEKVLRSAFELHDIHGGRRRAEDHHFKGLQKVRVIIHDFEPGNPLVLENYPEPKFDDMTRSRILHVFKDRGDSAETVDAPFDFSWEPSPMYVS